MHNYESFFTNKAAGSLAEAIFTTDQKTSPNVILMIFIHFAQVQVLCDAKTLSQRSGSVKGRATPDYELP